MLTDEPNEIATAIVNRLVHAWNAADGAAFGAEFTADGDFVNIFGVQMRGRSEIEKRHQYLFDALFAGSTCELAVVDARVLAPNVVLAHSTSIIKSPYGTHDRGTAKPTNSSYCARRWHVALSRRA